MGWSQDAIRKGASAEYLAKAFFSKKGFTIYDCDTHEKPFDFLIELDGETKKVQVKAGLHARGLLRFRNKHGANNGSYSVEDYDILAGIWVEKSKIYLFESKVINGPDRKETITVERLDGRELSRHSRILPYYTGSI